MTALPPEPEPTRAEARRADVRPWPEACRQRLESALEELLGRLARATEPAERAADAEAASPEAPSDDVLADDAVADNALADDAAANAFDRIRVLFDLSDFESDLLLLAAGVELDGRVGQALGGALPSAPATFADVTFAPVTFAPVTFAPVTFAEAAARLEGAHWSALAPDGPLRRERLVELGPPVDVGHPSGAGLAHRPIGIDEAVLHELLGLPQLDGALRPLVDPLPASLADDLLEGERQAAERLASIWAGSRAPSIGMGLPLVHLVAGSGTAEPSVANAVAVAAARALGWSAFGLDAGRLASASAEEIEELAGRWRRDALLQSLVLVIDDGGVTPSGSSADGGAAGGALGLATALRHWLGRIDGPVVLALDPRAAGGPARRPCLRLDVASVRSAETTETWCRALESAFDALGHGASKNRSALESLADGLGRQFSLPTQAIAEVVVGAVAACTIPADGALADADPADTDTDTDTETGAGRALEQELWRRARQRARGGLDSLAERLEPKAAWDDLVLPPAQAEVLRSVAAHVRQRGRVYDTWGFADKSARGLGIGALFSGPSGTGKTLAAEVLAHELHLDLYRIDLAALVSKYIGETERNLGRLFDAAERSGAILLFDEADSLFGKRSEVKDSHDRYANLEVSYLLQRVESYRGLAVLTTNFEKSVDTAFLRRLRFVVPFPFPGAAERRQIWARVFPAATPTEQLDLDRLARLSVTGGSIRNIALGAAFRAADQRRAVGMLDLQAAARAELAKLDRPVPESELRGWSP